MKFSIILPAYNVEQYLTPALECLLEQTYEEFEAIIVDDCATDATGQIADDFVKRPECKGRFRVIHKEKNEGLSAARNTGMDAATGEYILFLDADDTCERDMLQKLADSLTEHPVDLLLYGFTEDYYNGAGNKEYTAVKVPMGGNTWEGLAKEHPKDFCDAIVELERQTMYGYAWNKAYRLMYLREKQLRFTKITHIEDILFNIAAFEEADSVTLLPQVMYHYRNGGQNRLTGKYLKDYFDLQKVRIQKFLDQQCRWRGCETKDLPETVLSAMAGFYFRAYQSSIVRDITHGDKKRDILKRAQKEQNAPLYLLLKEHMQTRGKMANFLYEPLVKGRLQSAYIRSFLIGMVQKYFPGLYARLKQNR